MYPTDEYLDLDRRSCSMFAPRECVCRRFRRQKTVSSPSTVQSSVASIAVLIDFSSMKSPNCGQRLGGLDGSSVLGHGAGSREVDSSDGGVRARDEI
ncbi:hypothetical protein Ae201684P_007136 [Aphanomyces euteiches]|uniref:Uncharacterized protein n=1 Tax=Aphanomyces euteiches TaxID=100861 RepID=A0A6G0X843_9STRA|nr:hypothetical protein Ae201684_007260 [Aphanomyces euteiches]KAH9100945.1 hypothetical protein Ae201684P_007136 [Aphanomyces euteiches]